MSTEISAKAEVAGYGVGGSYKKEYGAPLILESCQHHIQIKEKKVGFWIWGKVIEEWRCRIHGNPDGTGSVTWYCKNEDRAKRIEG